MLAVHIISGKVLAQATGNQVDLAHIGLAHPIIAHHGQRAVLAHKARHVGLAVRPGRQIGMRIGDGNLDVAAMGHAGHVPAHTAAIHDDGHVRVLFLHHHAQHGRAGHQAAHGSDGGIRGVVQIARLLGQGSGAHQQHARLSPTYGHAQQRILFGIRLIHHFAFSFGRMARICHLSSPGRGARRASFP